MGAAVERYDCLLQEVLQQVVLIAQQNCKFSGGRLVSGFKLRSSCTSHNLKGLSKGLHRVTMQHRKSAAAGKEVCSDMRGLIQTGLSTIVTKD